jgi:phosphatidylglycerophosphate synthase
VKRVFTVADVLTGLRVPLALLFPFVSDARGRLLIVGGVAATDFFDGILARRHGGTRVGAFLDPIADKLFMAVAFLTVARDTVLHPLEIVGILLRDIVAVAAFVGTWLLGRPVALPARAGGKWVTGLQLLTLVAWIGHSPSLRPLAWATTAVACYALWDYAMAVRRSANRGGETT